MKGPDGLPMDLFIVQFHDKHRWLLDPIFGTNSHHPVSMPESVGQRWELEFALGMNSINGDETPSRRKYGAG